jgi:prepilin-type N-terminal cleavage/methylation domain-containing protein
MRLLLPAFRSQTGVTLMELIVTLALMAILGAGMTAAVQMTSHWSTELQDDAVSQNEIRASFERLVQDLRQAYVGDGSPPIEFMGANDITFLSPDRATPFHLRRISYRLVGGRLERAMATSTDTDGAPWAIPALGPWRKQIGGVANSTLFVYRDEAGNPTTSLTDVRTVDVTLRVKSTNTATQRLTYKTSVSIRIQAAQG